MGKKGKSKINWGKIGKKWKKASDWVETNVNPDVYKGGFGTGGFDEYEIPGSPDLFGGLGTTTTTTKRKKTTKKKSASRKHSTGGKRITIYLD